MVTSKKALVVEDNRLHKDFVTTILSGLGYTVFTAADGDEGLEIMDREDAITLIVTDIIMPKKEGIGFIRAIRSRHLEVKIVVVTGSVNFKTVAETALLFGADTVFKKPFDVDEFIAMLEHLGCGDEQQTALRGTVCRGDLHYLSR
jgi:DNA-binding response OmpR family regulator